MRRALGWVGAVWGLAGVVALLSSAVFRLSPLAVEAIRAGLTPLQWAAWVGIVGVMAYTEGYKAFQLQFSPRVVARAQSLLSDPRPARVILAPAFCMGFFGATRKRMIVAWTITSGIIVLVILVRHLAQPWRGIIDAGVVVGLSWGVLAIFWFAFQALQGATMPVPADLPIST